MHASPRAAPCPPPPAWYAPRTCKPASLLTCHPAAPLLPRLQALQILDNEEEIHVPRVLVYDHKASGVSREAIHASLVEGRDVWWQVRCA